MGKQSLINWTEMTNFSPDPDYVGDTVALANKAMWEVVKETL